MIVRRLFVASVAATTLFPFPAEALASVGEAAMSTVPDLLALLAREDPKSDPRDMQRRGGPPEGNASP